MKPSIDVRKELGKEGHVLNILVSASNVLIGLGRNADVIAMRSMFHQTRNVWDGLKVINNYVTLYWDGKTLEEYNKESIKRDAEISKEYAVLVSDRVGGDS